MPRCACLKTATASPSLYDLDLLPWFNFLQLQRKHIHVALVKSFSFVSFEQCIWLLKETQDNLSRGNIGAVEQLQSLFPELGRLQFLYGDLGDSKRVNEIFAQNAFDAVMHFAAIAYVSESMADPLRYYHNITFNTLTVLEAMKTHGVKKLIYSSTCATYGEPEQMPITEDTPQVFHLVLFLVFIVDSRCEIAVQIG
jgi:UDP-arabinose 4-epimerase